MVQERELLPLTSLKEYDLQLSWPLLASSIKNNHILLPCLPSLNLTASLDTVPKIDSDFPLDSCVGSRIIRSGSPFLFLSLEFLYYPLQPNVPSQLLPSLAWKSGPCVFPLALISCPFPSSPHGCFLIRVKIFCGLRLNIRSFPFTFIIARCMGVFSLFIENYVSLPFLIKILWDLFLIRRLDCNKTGYPSI